MPLQSMLDLIEIARKHNWVIGAFNTSNLEISISISDAAKELGYPVCIQISPPSAELSGYDYIAGIVGVCAKHSNIPICLHLDHGKTFQDVKNAVESGFTSVMIDGSALPYEQNIKLTKDVVKYCHSMGISVEAELGALRGKEDLYLPEAQTKTDPKLVNDFCDETGCDLLAVSVGNVHGLKEQGQIDFKLLEEITMSTNVPLVIHGGSGLPSSTLSQFRKYNVTKVNFSSELKKAFISAIGNCYNQNNDDYDIVSVTKVVKENVKGIVLSKLRALNE